MIVEKIATTATYALRLSVLKTCEAYNYKYKGDFDKTTTHYGAFLSDKLPF